MANLMLATIRGDIMIFSYAEFTQFVHHMKDIGKVIPFVEWDHSSNAILLRHDVDFDIEAAYQLALVEAECDIRSTFFFLTTCHTYNPFSSTNRNKLREMSKMGFEIGLHFDPTIYGDANREDLTAFVNHEAGMLTSIIGTPVNSISLHNPSVHGLYPLFEGYCNAYDPKFFSDKSYISDSRMDFRGKNPYEFVEKVKEHPIQILLHPLHYSEHRLSYPEIFYEHLKKYANDIHDAFLINSTYSKQISPMDLFSFLVNKGRS